MDSIKIDFKITKLFFKCSNIVRGNINLYSGAQNYAAFDEVLEGSELDLPWYTV